jgi:hypothetical protein
MSIERKDNPYNRSMKWRLVTSLPNGGKNVEWFKTKTEAEYRKEHYEKTRGMYTKGSWAVKSKGLHQTPVQRARKVYALKGRRRWCPANFPESYMPLKKIKKK